MENLNQNPNQDSSPTFDEINNSLKEILFPEPKKEIKNYGNELLIELIFR